MAKDESVRSRIANSKGDYDVLCLGKMDKFQEDGAIRLIYHLEYLGKRPFLLMDLIDESQKRLLLQFLEKHGISGGFALIKDSTEDAGLSIVRRSRIVHTDAKTLLGPSKAKIINILNEAKSQEKIISFDPNFKSEKDIPKDIFPVDLVCPALRDAKVLFGDMSQDALIKRYHSLGKVVVMTLGKDGSVVSDGKATINILPDECIGIDNFGAGDMYWSVFMASLLDGCRLESAGRKASYAASRVIESRKSLLEKDQYTEIKAFMDMF